MMRNTLKIKKKSHFFPRLLASVRWELIFFFPPTWFWSQVSPAPTEREFFTPDDATCSFKPHRQWKVKTAASHMLCALWCSGRSWDSLQELLALRSAFGPAALQLKNPSLIFPLHHLSEGRRCESIPPHLVPNNLSPPPPPSPPHCCQRGYRGAAQPERSRRSAFRSGQRPGKGVTDEPEVDDRDRVSPPLGIIALCTSPDASNMRVRSKGPAGITALLASMLLGSCGTGEKGERLRALSCRAEERRQVLLVHRGYNRLFIKGAMDFQLFASG